MPITFYRLWAHALPAEPRADRSACHHRMHLYWVFPRTRLTARRGNKGTIGSSLRRRTYRVLERIRRKSLGKKHKIVTKEQPPRPPSTSKSLSHNIRLYSSLTLIIITKSPPASPRCFIP
eukprot:jgi/Botrbrau1/23580/Bobra.0141s0044.1